MMFLYYEDINTEVPVEENEVTGSAFARCKYKVNSILKRKHMKYLMIDYPP